MSRRHAGKSELTHLRAAVRVMHGLNRFYARAYHRLEVLAPCRLPATGPAILICNHTSALDPLLIQSCCPRLVTWMMAREYYELPILRAVFDTVGVIPVARGARDMTATRAALRALERGQLLGIFPEGKIETSDELLPFQTGVAMMAMKTGVPVYPAYLSGTQRNCAILSGLLLPQSASIVFGAEVPIDRTASDRDGLAAAAESMRLAVASLRPARLNTCPRQDL